MSTSSPSRTVPGHQIPDLTFDARSPAGADVPPAAVDATAPAPAPIVHHPDDPKFRLVPRARATVVNALAGVRKTWSMVVNAEAKAAPKFVQSMDVAPGVAARRAQDEGKVDGVPKSVAVAIVVVLALLLGGVFWVAFHTA